MTALWKGIVLGVALPCLFMTGCSQSKPADTPASQVTNSPVASTTAPSPDQSPSTSASAKTTKTPSTPEEQYCADYETILGSGTEETKDDETMDYEKFSAWAGDMIKKYEAASKNAPKKLQKNYEQVIQYLKDLKVTVDSKDKDAIIAQMRYLPKLNAAMENIRTTSERLCK